MPNEKSIIEGDEPKIQIVEYRVKTVDEEKRRAEEKAASDDPGLYTVTEATPSSGGVFPPSAIVEPFSPEEIAAHTPGEAGAEETKSKSEPEPERAPE